MRFSAVIFDLDGTLIDTNGLIVATFQSILKQELGLDLTPEQIYPYFGEPLPVTMARFSPTRAEELTIAYRKWNVDQHDRLLRQFEGVHQMITDLKQAGVKLGIATSKKVAMARRGLKASNLEHHFEAVVGMDETELHKPNPEPALLALSRLGEAPGSHVLMVGDSQFDILCGRNAGLKTAAVGWTKINRELLALSLPDYWVEHPQDLTALILDR
jgi:pyrophosphatase PpaX